MSILKAHPSKQELCDLLSSLEEKKLTKTVKELSEQEIGWLQNNYSGNSPLRVSKENQVGWTKSDIEIYTYTIWIDT